MLSVLLLLAVIWGLGPRLGLPMALRWSFTGLIMAAVLSAHAVLPQGHPILAALGGSFAGWATLCGAAMVIALYVAALKALKSRAREPEMAGADPSDAPFSDAELERYARHIILREVGGPGQKALKDARVLVVGAGGLGSPALMYLAAAGVGTIGVIDDDIVSVSNLQRQVIHRDADIDLPKVFSAEAAMRAQNPHITVRPYNRRLTDDTAAALFADYDLILEGSDNFATRYLVNRAAAAAGIPVIGGAITQWEGQLSTWDPASGAPCYQCVFPEEPAPGLAPSCAEAGVMGPLPGIIGSAMALEAVKEITGAGEGMRARLLIWDGLYGETRLIRTKPRADCPVCGSKQA